MTKFDLSEKTYSELFDLKASARQKTMLKIAQAAIQNYASLGPDKTTYETIAKASDVSRPLVHKYFPEKRDVFLLAVKYIRLEFQGMAISAIGSAGTPQAMLRAYVDSTFEWIRTRHDHVVVWMLFLYQTTIDAEMMALNTELARVGHARITQLLQLGAKQGVFKITHAEEQAKQIQGVITGALMMAISEQPMATHNRLQSATVETCLRIAGV